MGFLKNTKLRIACLCLMCAVCLVLTVGITYGRYQWDFPRVSYLFSPETPGQVVLCGGGVSQAWIDGGNLPPMEETWELTPTGAKLDFGVTNGFPGNFTSREQVLEIRLAAGLSVASPENLQVILSWEDENGQTRSLQAIPEPIEQGSFLYDSLGDGWVYHIDSDSDRQFTLPGGNLSYRNFTISVSGDVDPALLELQVSGRFAD